MLSKDNEIWYCSLGSHADASNKNSTLTNTPYKFRLVWRLFIATRPHITEDFRGIISISALCRPSVLLFFFGSAIVISSWLGGSFISKMRVCYQAHVVVPCFFVSSLCEPPFYRKYPSLAIVNVFLFVRYNVIRYWYMMLHFYYFPRKVLVLDGLIWALFCLPYH
jgi:hypothetical protein